MLQSFYESPQFNLYHEKNQIQHFPEKPDKIRKSEYIRSPNMITDKS